MTPSAALCGVHKACTEVYQFKSILSHFRQKAPGSLSLTLTTRLTTIHIVVNLVVSSEYIPLNENVARRGDVYCRR